jgi:L-alanine-DL-glutamate epimerase-like enolase superfamily enzyme
VARALPGPVNGLMTVPPGPGLGVDVSDAALSEVLVEEIR